MFIGLLGTLWMDVKILNEKKELGALKISGF